MSKSKKNKKESEKELKTIKTRKAIMGDAQTTLMKRVVIIGDTHCGHVTGLTHPNWQFNKTSSDKRIRLLARVQDQAWNWYEIQARKLGPVDILIMNGDAIDGRGEKSGGTELLTSDRNDQCKMAAKCIMAFRPKRVFIVRGTPYHTGSQEDFEDIIKEMLPDDLKETCIVSDMLDLTVIVGSKEVVFNVKHDLGNSNVPGGRQTAVAKDKYFNMFWADRDGQKRADFIVRNHVHYFAGNVEIVGGKEVWGIVNPALQLVGPDFGTKFGKRCRGTVDFGFTYYDITEKGVSWEPVYTVLPVQKVGAGVVA